jgi:hypothetical protein
MANNLLEGQDNWSTHSQYTYRTSYIRFALLICASDLLTQMK